MTAILSLGHMAEELSTACRGAADALENLSNLRPVFQATTQVEIYPPWHIQIAKAVEIDSV